MVMRFVKKYFFLILAVLVAVFGYIHIAVSGKEYVYVRNDINSSKTITDIKVDNDSTGNVEITGWETTDKSLIIHLRSVAPGKVFIFIDCPDNPGLGVFYVHNNGVITHDLFFGDCTGCSAVLTAIVIYLLIVLTYLVIKYFMLEKLSHYSYDNVLYLGLIIFAVFFIYSQIKSVVYKNGINGAFYQAMASSQEFVLFTFPLIIITTVFVTISNIKLIRKEGRTWRNMLGVILGLALGIGALLPFVIGTYLQNSNIIDVHYSRGTGRFIEMFIENSISAVVSYLECILLGTIITGIKTARHIPKFDKDFIIIHGCQIKKDGSLTALLKSRADRAIEFAKMQKERNGRPIVFVPSGGKGSDEIISEGEAIKRYLLSQGIKERDILEETRSTTTEENFRFAHDLIRKFHGSDYFNIVFCTTNYHVFRSGMLADKLGLRVEGIGSRTKSYFWINAFVREYIATLVEKKKKHIKMVVILLLINLIGSILMYISEAVLF